MGIQGWYLCEGQGLEGVQGTYPPIFKGCEHNGVKKTHKSGLFWGDMARLTFGARSVDFLKIMDFGVLTKSNVVGL